VTAGFTCQEGKLTSVGAGTSAGKSGIYRAGQFCKPGNELLYNQYRLSCVQGRLKSQ
jgi:hypothetical protein